MIKLLADNPLLLLFIVSAIGYTIGRIKVKGSSLGVAAVLFVGLAFGALSPDLKLPEIIFLMGLAIFVYTIGLSSGPGFFASFNRKGLRDNLFVWGVLTVALLITLGAHFLLGLKSTITAGMYAGSLTNTPALAGLLDTINNTAPAAVRDAMLAEPVVGYSVAYPMGVMGVILAIFLLQRAWKIDYPKDAYEVRRILPVEQELGNRTVRVTQAAVTGTALEELTRTRSWIVVFGRTKRGEQVGLSTGQTRLELGDLISVIGPPEDVDEVVPQLGEIADEQLELDRSEYDFRRMFVSRPEVTGRRLSELNLIDRFGALVTRVRRGDIDVLATGATRLELGDRVRVVAPPERMKEIAGFFGDSYRSLSELDLLAFGLGISLGLLVGLIPIPLPGGLTFKLGFAGGPLIVALILGALIRTGPIVWSLPYSANLTLRQIGLIFLLAGIGIRSGYTFLSTLAQSGGVAIFLAAMIITCTTAFLALSIGYKVLKIPFGLLTGIVAALHTQPAVLGFSLEQADNDLPNIGYALIFPIATITKILYAQLLLTLLK